ncbi:MAG: UvrD-helicase domain-containing protein [Actinomycetes bacterium]
MTTQQTPDQTGITLGGLTVIAASAGTGKKFTINQTVARYVAEIGIPIDRFLLVTYTRAAAAELRTRTRAALVEARDAVERDGGPEHHATRLGRAIADFDTATITTIHGFCQLALGSLGVQVTRVGTDSFDQADDSLTRDVTRDHLIRALADDPSALDRTGVGARTEDDPTRIEQAILAVVQRTIANQGSHLLSPRPALDPFDPASLAASWGELSAAIVRDITARRRAARISTFDSLISDLAACLAPDSPVAERTATVLRSRFAVVMVDEFQDTDALQWQIFQRGFVDPSFEDARAVFLVGDPKQAIYRFRGADVGTYIRATRTEHARIRTLSVNWRSDASLIEGLNALFAGMRFDRLGTIAYGPASAQPSAERAGFRLAEHTPAPIEIRWVPPSRTALARDDILLELPSLILQHLAGSLPGPDGADRRAVSPNDIAVVVKSNADGDLIARVLRDAGIPAVRAGVGTVEESPAARQLRALLHAIARPSDARRARMIASGWFFGLDSSATVADEALAHVQARIGVLSQLLTTRGIYALWSELQHDRTTLESIARLGDGDRGRTDLDHLIELLHLQLEGRTASAERCLAVLDDLVAIGGEADERRRRIDSDAKAVQITTMHASKGLEYPIVLIPFGTKQPNLTNIQPYVFGHEGQRWVDAGPSIAWNDVASLGAIGDLTTRKSASTDEAIDEDRRLAYVALTRAKHRLVIWVRHGKGAEQGGLGRILWDPRDQRGALRSDADATTLKPDDDVAAETLYAGLAALAPGCIDVTPAADAPASASAEVRPADGARPARPTRHTERALSRRGWRAWSYSTLTAEGTGVSHYGPDAVRDDEVEGPVDGEVRSNPWDALSAGTGFGDAVHRIMEAADFASLRPDQPEDRAQAAILSAVERHAFRLAPADDPGLLAERLLAVARTPLDPPFEGATVAEVLAPGSLRELQFSLELGAPAGPPADIGSIAELARHLDDGDPFTDYFRRIGRGMLAADELRGYLTGSIDLVVRHRVGLRNRYSVVDYKTNRSPNGRYDRDALAAIMVHGNYPLQAALYSVVLHRFLRLRLGREYQPEINFGGASYWFVRGMVGVDTPIAGQHRDGVFSWRPSIRFLDGLDEMLRGSS